MRAMGGRPVLMQRFPQGAGGPSFFQKRVPDERAGLARDDDRADRQRHAVARARGGRRRARRVGGQPRLPRLPRLAEPRRRPRARRRAAPGPRPAAGHRLRRGARGRMGAQGAAGRARHRRASPRRPATAACTSTSGCSRAGTPTRSARRPWPSRASSSAAAPTSSPPPGGRRSAASGSSSTTTRTPRTRRSSARGRCARARARRSRRRVRWEELDDVDPDELTLATVPGRRRARRRPVGRDRRRAAVARAAPRAARARPGERPARRAVAAGLPQAARRAAARRAEPRPASVAGRALQERRVDDDLSVAELDLQAREVGLEVLQAARADDRRRDPGAAAQPRQRDRRRRRIDLSATPVSASMTSNWASVGPPVICPRDAASIAASRVYLPDRNPPASGLQGMTPIPASSASGMSSPSTGRARSASVDLPITGGSRRRRWASGSRCARRSSRPCCSSRSIQFQKLIRLQEARLRLLARPDDVAGAGYAVGYDSPSQFSRDYRRQFGRPPGRDAARLRRVAAA